MRVLYVNHTAEVSGAERSLLVLLAGLPQGVDPLVATPPGPLAHAVQDLDVPVAFIAGTSGSLRLHPLHTPRAVADMSLAALQVRRAARRHAAEIVHSNSIRAGIELGIARVPRAAAVAHVRDNLPSGVTTSASMRLIAATATTVVANSRYTAAAVRAAAAKARVEVVHPAIDVREFDPARIDRESARARLGSAGGRKLLLGVVAQLSPWKGQDTAIEALALLCRQGLDAHLLLIGSAKFVARATRFDNEAYVRRLRALIDHHGLQERVSLLGERDDVARLIRALDALLLPSHEEPFGRALLEAMALEVPVLATNIGGPPELVRDGRDGYLLPPREPAAWSEAVRRLAADPARAREMGRNGRARVAESFDVAAHVQAMLGVYRRASALRKGPSRGGAAAERDGA